MAKKSLKERLKDGETVIGTWNIIPSPTLVEIIGCSGLDFLVIDSEHGPGNFETAENLARAAEVTGMSPIMRVPDKEVHSILSALDIGMHGIQVPHVSTKEEAELIVERAKYYPVGKRGLSPFTRAGKYSLLEHDHAARSNKNTIIVLNIEGIDGIENLAEISTVPDIDVIFIGPYDLSQSIGKPGKVNDPEVMKLIKKSANILKSNGITCGSFARDEAYLKSLIQCGVKYLTYMVDTAMILKSYKAFKDFFDKFTMSKRKR